MSASGNSWQSPSVSEKEVSILTKLSELRCQNFWNPPPHSRRHQHFIIPIPTSSKTFCSIFKVNGKSSAEHSNTVAPTSRQRGVELYQPRERSILTKSAMRRKSTRMWHAAGLEVQGGGARQPQAPRGSHPPRSCTAAVRTAPGARASRLPPPCWRRAPAARSPPAEAFCFLLPEPKWFLISLHHFPNLTTTIADSLLTAGIPGVPHASPLPRTGPPGPVPGI